MFVLQHLKIDYVVFEQFSNGVIVDVEMLMLDTHVGHRMHSGQEFPCYRKNIDEIRKEKKNFTSIIGSLVVLEIKLADGLSIFDLNG
jgi:hypothetical protein